MYFIVSRQLRIERVRMKLNTRTMRLRCFFCLLCFISVITGCNSQRIYGHSQPKIPLRVIKEQSKIRTAEEFMRLVIIPSDPDITFDELEYHPRSGSGGRTFPIQNLDKIAKAAVCEPRPLPVPIPPDSDTRVIYFPTCTTLDQCGGCCGDELMVCAPTSTETVKVEVMMRRLKEDGNYEYIGDKEVTLQKHKSCECLCKIKPEHCDTNIQLYDKDNCACKCRNARQARLCGHPKKWNEKHCGCICPNMVNCLDGEVFDFSTCRCAPAADLMLRNRPTHRISSNRCSHIHCDRGQVADFVRGMCQCVTIINQFEMQNYNYFDY